MSSLITPQKLIELVLQRKTKPMTLKPYENNVQKILFWVALISFGAGTLIGLLIQLFHKCFSNSKFGSVGLGLLIFSMIMGFSYQLSMAWPLFAKLKYPEKNVSQPIVDEFNEDVDLISELARDYQEYHLEYAKESFLLLSEQFRIRIGMLVGAIDKVGIIPVAATAYLSTKKAIKDGVVVFSEIEWIFAAFVLLYILAVHMVSVSHQIDRVTLIYKQALSVKRTNRT